MVNTKEFKNWHKLEVSRKTGQLAVIEANVEREMKRIKVEVKEDGLWKEVDKNDPLYEKVDEDQRC